MEPSTDLWERVRGLFERSLELEPGAREAFVAEAAGTDRALCAEVLLLLAEDAAQDGYMEPPLVPVRGALQRLADEPAWDGGAGFPEEALGRRLGPWRLEAILGAGGMSTVYLAARVDAQFDKKVALKLIKRGMDTDDILRRFLNERQLLADLEHPGIARLLDGGATDDGLPFLVMELVEGLPLDKYCDAQRLDVQQRLGLFRRVCEPVQFAHERGVIHRDLKPSNILVTAQGEAKLLDFGIAKVLDATASSRTIDVTATELRLMTPEYACPEQVRGDPISPASDVYSLGVILYELLTGRRPYPMTTRLRGDIERVICEFEPARPSVVIERPASDPATGASSPQEISTRRKTDSRRLRARLAGDLDTICLMALRKEPERRYASAAELSDDIARSLTGLPVRARPDSLRYRTGKFVRRHRLLVGAAAGIFLTLAAGLVTSASFWASESVQRRKAEEREYASRIAAAGLALRAYDAADARRHLELAPERLRGWEWQHFMGRTDRSERTFVGNAGPLLCCAISPDGRLLAAGGDGLEVVVWELGTGREMARWSGHPGSINTLEFSPDGEHLLAGRVRRSVAVWSLAERRVVREWKEHPGGFDCATYDRTGARVAAGGFDGAVLVWDARTGEELARLTGHGEMVNSVVFHPEGALLASSSADDSARLWDLADGGALRFTCEYGKGPARLTFLGDGDAFATGDDDGVVAVWDAIGERPVLEFEAHGKPIWNLAVEPDAKQLVTSSTDGTVRRWDLRTGQPLGLLLGHVDAARGLAMHPGRALLASSSADGTAKLWRTDCDDVKALLGRPAWMPGLALDPSGAFVVDGGEQAVTAWHVDGQRSWSLPIEGVVGAAAVDPEAVRVAIGCMKRVLVLDARNGDLQHVLPCADGVHDVAFSPDGHTLAASTGKGAVHAWSTADGAELFTVPANGHWANDLDFLHDGTRILWCSPEGKAHVIDARTGAELVTVLAPAGVWGVAYHPSGERFAAALADATVRVYESETGAELDVLEGHSLHVYCVDYSPDGERLASGSKDCTVRLWDATTGREVAVLYGHEQRVDDVQFSADGLLLASKSIDGEIRLWDAAYPQSP